MLRIISLMKHRGEFNAPWIAALFAVFVNQYRNPAVYRFGQFRVALIPKYRACMCIRIEQRQIVAG